MLWVEQTLIDQPETPSQSHAGTRRVNCFHLWALSVQKGGCNWRYLDVGKRFPSMMSCSAQNLWEFKSFRGEFEPLISVQFSQTVLN